MKDFLKQFDVTEVICLLILGAVDIIALLKGMNDLALTISGILGGYLTKSAVKPSALTVSQNPLTPGNHRLEN